MAAELAESKTVPAETTTAAIGKLDPFGAFRTLVTDTVGEFAKIVEKGPSVFLFAFGATLMVIALFMEVDFNGYRLADLSTGEFIAVMVVGLFLLLLGSGFRIFQYLSLGRIERTAMEQGAKLLEPIAEAGKELITRREEKPPL